MHVYIQFQNSKDKQYTSLIQSFYDTHCDEDGAWLQDEARVQYVSNVFFNLLFIYLFPQTRTLMIHWNIIL